MKWELRGKTAIITGASTGIGKALALALAARGVHLGLGARGQAELEAVAAECRALGVRALAVPVDVADPAQCKHFVDTCVSELGACDLLVNNAGIGTGGRIDVESLSDWQRVIDINLLGVVRGCQTFTPILKQQRSGHIVNTASLAGLIHGPGMSSYNAAKAGVVALSETLRFELAPWDIKVSAICPAFFRTNLHQSLQGKDVAMEETAVQLITKAGMSADEVAATVIKGIEANRAIILTDRQGHLATFAKRYLRPAYNRWGMEGGARLANRRVGAKAPREGSEA